MLRSLSSHSGGGEHCIDRWFMNQIVQEETLTAEAADSPDFTPYSESCTNHVLLRFSYSTQNGACVHQLLTPAGRSHRAETLCPSPLGR